MVNLFDPVDSNQQNSNETGNPSDSGTSVKNCNACSGITPLTHTLYDTNPLDNGVFNGINTQSIGSNKAISDFNAQLKDIDRELSKFNSDESSHLMPIVSESPLVRIQDQIHETQAVNVNEARASYEPTRVSLNPKPLCDLPT